MKKFATKLAVALAFVAVASSAKAALSQSVNIVLTMANLSVARIGGTGDIAISGGPNGDVVSERIIIQNDGASVERFLVRLANAGTNWALITGTHAANPTMGVNQYRLSALWHQWDVTPATSEFADNDILTPGDGFSGLTTFFNDAETHGINADNQAGSVNVLAERSLFIRGELPAVGSVPVEVNTVVVTAGLP